MKKVVALTVFAACLLMAAGQSATIGKVRVAKGDDGVPQRMNVQGYLTDNGGVALNDTIPMVYKVYDDTTASPLWTSGNMSVPVMEGLFSVRLAVPQSLFVPGSPLWLEVVPNLSPLRPFVEITSVGFSYHSSRSDTANYALAGPDGGGGVDTIWQGEGVVLSPNPVTHTGTVSFDQSYGDGRYAGISHQHTLTHTGDATGSGSVDGTWPLTLSNTGVTPNSYTSTNLTVDSKGRITAASNGGGGITRPISPPIAAAEIAKPCTLAGAVGGPTGTGVLTVRNDASGDGIVVDSTSGTGIIIKRAGQYGLSVNNASNYGVRVGLSSSVGIAIDTTGNSAIRITKSGNRGISISQTAADGINVTGVQGNYGVYAEDLNGRGGYFRNSNGSYYALTAYNASGSTSQGLYVNGSAVSTGGWNFLLKDGVAGFGLVGPDMDIVASGSGVLADGQTTINLEPSLQQVVSPGVPLRVIISPTSECNGILVASKTATSFTVRELLGGKSSASFDWIAVARIKGGEKRPDAPKRVEDAAKQQEPEKSDR